MVRLSGRTTLRPREPHRRTHRRRPVADAASANSSRDPVRRRGAAPSLGTPTGREQLADFLETKATEAKRVTTDAQEASVRLAASLQAVGQQFDTAAT